MAKAPCSELRTSYEICFPILDNSNFRVKFDRYRRRTDGLIDSHRTKNINVCLEVEYETENKTIIIVHRILYRFIVYILLNICI